MWIVKSTSQLSWIKEWLERIASAAPHGLLRFEVYVTGREDQDKMHAFADELLPGLVKAQSARRTSLTPSNASDDTLIGYHLPGKAKVPGLEPFVSLHAGRPDFLALVQTEVAATAYSNWISVGACGPVPMNESIVAAVRKEIQPGAVWRGENRRNIGLNVE